MKKLFTFYTPLVLIVLLLVAGVLWYAVFYDAGTAKAFGNGYTYRRSITIDHTKVPNTNRTDFPMLISGTYAYLANTGSGGNVVNANGYDIIFTSDAAGTAVLPFEKESYSSSSGAVNYWVKVSTVSTSVDTVIYMFYGNSSVSTDQSNKTGVWDSNYKGVWHLSDNAANTTVVESTTNAVTGTAVANTSTKTTTGAVASALTFNGTSDQINVFKASGFWDSTGSTIMTLSAWIKISADISDGSFATIFGNDDGGCTNPCWQMEKIAGAGNYQLSYYDGSTVRLGTTQNYTIGTWYYVTMTRTSSTLNYYKNGADAGSASGITWASGVTPTTMFIGGRNQEYFQGSIDEVKTSYAIARTSDWIKTEYNNQSSPSTFYTIESSPSQGGGESAHVGIRGGSQTVLPVKIRGGGGGGVIFR